MKRITFLMIVSCLVLLADLQAQKFPGLDKSPADIAYFRADNEAKIKVIYSRPQKNDRKIFGELIKYDKEWRLGANEATEITFYQDVMLGGETLKAGTYTVFATPGEESWTFTFNSQLNQWGNYRHDKSKDILTAQGTPSKTDGTVEAFTIIFQEIEGGAEMIAAWDDTMVSLPIKF